MPCVIRSDYETKLPADIGEALQLSDLGGKKAIINVGSVGQPRDKDPRACYVVVDDHSVRWRRVAYDTARTLERFKATPRLHPTLGERLLVGT